MAPGKVLASVTAAILCGGVAVVAGPNWPTWRGENMQGLAHDANPPTEFSEDNNLKWKVPVPGRGHSTPVIWGGKIFLLTAIETDIPAKVAAEAPPPAGDGRGSSRFGIKKAEHEYKFDVVCFNRQDGKILWQRTVRQEVPHAGHHRDHGYASGSPVTDGDHLWAFLGSRGMHCLDLNGNIVWSVDLGKLQTRMSFGEGSSPVLVGKAIVAVVDHEGDSFIVALEKSTGKELWRRERDEHTSWTTPMVITQDGRTEVVVSGTNRTRSYDPETGDILWECSGQTDNVIPSPVIGFGMIYCTSGFRGAAMQAIKPGGSGDLTGTDAVVWEVKEHTPYVPSPLLYGDFLYMCAGNHAKLSCLNAKTGAFHYSRQTIEEIRGVYASPVGASGRIYLAGRQGMVAVFKNGPQFEVLSINKLDEGFDASPAIAGDALFLRGSKSLYCISK